MREALALVRAGWLTASSYRVTMLLSVASLLAGVVPLYFIARALQPIMARSVASQGGQYFGFLLLGLVALSLVTTAVNTLPGAIGSTISTGTLEALFSTRASLPSLLVGLAGYSFAWSAARAALLFVTGWMLGVHVAWRGAPIGLGILVLLVCAYIPIGLIAAAAVLAFRTSGPLPKIIVAVSGLLGGVYYPTNVIPSWIQALSAAVPLTYGLRALRRTLLEGAPLSAVLTDLLVLAAFVVVLMVVGAYLFARALRLARQSGTLAQY